MGGAKSVSTPPDPDPTPMVTGDSSAEVQSARREEKKRSSATYGRQKTVIAGNKTVEPATKTTILGG